MKKTLFSALLMTSFAFNVHAYDANLAKGWEKFYANMNQEAFANSKVSITAEDTLKLIREKKKYLLVDLRSAGEHSVFSLNLKNSMHIEFNHLFEKENLDKLPTDIPVILVCHSGTRGVMGAVGLQQIGFKNIHVLQNGFIALAEDNTVTNAPKEAEAK